MKRLLLLFLLSGIIHFWGWGQSAGDYRSLKSGNWDVADNWEIFRKGIWIAADLPPQNPISATISILSIHTITASNDLLGEKQNQGGKLIVQGILNMGSYIIKGMKAPSFSELIIEGTLITSGEVTVKSFTIASSGYFKTSYKGKNGWWADNNAPSEMITDGTVEFNGTDNQRIPVPPNTYKNIIVSGTGPKILTGNATIAGLLTINSGVTLEVNGYDLSLSGPGILINGTLNGGGNSSLTFGGGNQTVSGTGTFNGTFNRVNVGTVNQSNTLLSVADVLKTNYLTIDKTTLNTNSSFTIGPNSKVDVYASLDIFFNDGLILQASNTYPYTCASLIVADGAPGAGGGNKTAKIELFLEGNSNMWHYISSPVSTLSETVFTGAANAAVTEYRENLISNDVNNGWVTSKGYHYNISTQVWESGSTPWSDLLAGHGYNYYSAASHTYTISGQINTNETSVTLAYNSGGFTPNALQQGYNLIGNPFTCGIDWDEVVTYNGGIFPDVVAPAIYFRVNGLTYTYNTGVTNPNTYNADGSLIPPMQGFFVKSNTNNTLLKIPVSSKTHTANKRYKGDIIIPLVRLQIENSGKIDQTVVRFDEKATLSFDNSFDAYKIFPSSDIPSISSSLGKIEYSINGIPFPQDSTEIPITIQIPVSGDYMISVAELAGLDTLNITLKDNLRNITVDLKTTGSYSFSSAQGKFANRFVLTVSNSTMSVQDIGASQASFNIFPGNGILNIRTISDNWNGTLGDIKIFDITGKLLSVHRKIEFINGDQIQIPENFRSGLYFVEITATGKRYVGKVWVR